MQILSKFFAIISPILYGIGLAYLLSPIQNFFENKVFVFKAEKKWAKSLRRALAVIVTMVILFAIITAAFCIFIPGIIKSADMLRTNLGGYVQKMENMMNDYMQGRIDENSAWGRVVGYIKDFFGVTPEKTLFGQITEKLTSWLTSLLSAENIKRFFSMGGALVGFLVDLVLTLIFTVYLLISKDRQVARMRKLCNAFFKKERVESIYRVAAMTDDRVGRYLRVQVIDSILVGLVSYVIYKIIGLEYAPLMALISGVTNIIPYFGPFIGAVPNGLLVLLATPNKLLAFIIAVVVIQQVDGNILIPIIQSGNMKLDTFWVLVGITIMGGIFGLPGMIIGVPIFSVIYVLIREKAEERLAKKGLPTETEAYRMGDRSRRADRPTPPLVKLYRRVRNWFRTRKEKKKAPALPPDKGAAEIGAAVKDTAQTDVPTAAQIGAQAEAQTKTQTEAQTEAQNADAPANAGPSAASAKELKPDEDVIDRAKVDARKLKNKLKKKK